MSENIPVDDISDVYMEASPDAKRAISNILLCGDNFALATYAGQTPSGMNLVNVDWKAVTPSMYMFLVYTLVGMGQQQFGEVWLNELVKNLISQSE